ncbi:MAG TPA: hypothetical protein VFF30_19390 [Nitrososphaerales archaeon]|nr:hypothetical protein [Nitrososphaerales archaeon]
MRETPYSRRNSTTRTASTGSRRSVATIGPAIIVTLVLIALLLGASSIQKISMGPAGNNQYLLNGSLANTEVATTCVTYSNTLVSSSSTTSQSFSCSPIVVFVFGSQTISPINSSGLDLWAKFNFTSSTQATSLTFVGSFKSSDNFSIQITYGNTSGYSKTTVLQNNNSQGEILLNQTLPINPSEHYLYEINIYSDMKNAVNTSVNVLTDFEPITCQPAAFSFYDQWPGAYPTTTASTH